MIVAMANPIVVRIVSKSLYQSGKIEFAARNCPTILDVLTAAFMYG